MKYIIPVAAAIVTIFILVLTQIPIGIEPLTEVFFENHTKLPVFIFLYKPYNFTFTVHNLEYMPMNYSYRITQDLNNLTLILNVGMISLENNQSASVLTTFKTNEPFNRSQVSIVVEKLLPNPQQRDPNLKNISIDLHFWIEPVQGTTITHI